MTTTVERVLNMMIRGPHFAGTCALGYAFAVIAVFVPRFGPSAIVMALVASVLLTLILLVPAIVVMGLVRERGATAHDLGRAGGVILGVALGYSLVTLQLAYLWGMLSTRSFTGALDATHQVLCAPDGLVFEYALLLAVPFGAFYFCAHRPTGSLARDTARTVTATLGVALPIIVHVTPPWMPLFALFPAVCVMVAAVALQFAYPSNE